MTDDVVHSLKPVPIRPALFRWSDDETMVPHERFLPLCRRQFVHGEDYALTLFERRSTRSHNHLFAVLKDAWDSLPEKWAERFPTPEHMRKWLLVQAGHAMNSQFVFDTSKDAVTFARGLRRFDEFAVIKVSGTVVDVWVAKSMSRQAVPTKDEFQALKNRVFDGLVMVTGNTRAELDAEGEQKMLPPARTATFEGGER